MGIPILLANKSKRCKKSARRDPIVEIRISEGEYVNRIGIIHNPFARKNRKKPSLADRLEQTVGDWGTLYNTKGVEELPGIAEEFLKNGTDILAVNGGDGTLQLALTAFHKVYGEKPLPKVVILRGGTMNTVSNSLKIKGNPESILKGVVAKLEKGEKLRRIPQHTLNVNGHIGFMAGAAVVTKFLDEYYSSTTRGPAQAAKMVSKLCASAFLKTPYAENLFSKVPMRVLVDGRDLGQESYMVILGCTVKEIGLGCKPTHRAYDRPGHLHFIASSMKPGDLVKELCALWAGKDIVHPDMYYNGVAKSVRLEFDGTLGWMMDGELYDSKEAIQIGVGPDTKIVY